MISWERLSTRLSSSQASRDQVRYDKVKIVAGKPLPHIETSLSGKRTI